MRSRNYLVRSMLGMTLASAVFIAGCGAPANNVTDNKKPALSTPTPDPCGAPTVDKQIVDGVYASISKAGLGGQAKHLNVISEQRMVRFIGWADSKTDKDTIVKEANGVQCVLKVAPDGLLDARPAPGNPLLPKPGGGCSAGTYACREFCIPEGQECTAMADSDSNANSNANSNSNVNRTVPNTAGNTNGSKTK